MANDGNTAMVRLAQFATGGRWFRSSRLWVYDIRGKGTPHAFRLCSPAVRVQVRLFTMPATFLTRCMCVQPLCRLNRYTFADAERASRGTVYFGGQNEALPALMRTHRVPTPEWAAAEDRKVLKESESKRDIAKSLKPLQDLHFADFEGNLGVQRARTAVLASRLTPPKGWGAGHTHVSGFRSPPWKERPPQEAPRYKCPNLLRERDLFIQVGFRPCVEG